LAVVLEALPWC